MTETWRISGSYYEACNCEAICPCRRQDGRLGGRSTYGQCDFVLSWKILEGQSGDITLNGLSVCMAGTYQDVGEEEPWSVFIYVDHAANDRQFAALGRIFSGQAQGNILFTGNIGKVLETKRARITLDHRAGAETITIAQTAQVKVDKMVDFDGTVSCGIPGHDRPGKESVSSIRVTDAPFDWNYTARCGFSTNFAYWN